MLGKRIRLPGPAMIVALLALFVALSGTAVAAGIVPLAKRALVADNAKKLNGATLKQVIGGIVRELRDFVVGIGLINDPSGNVPHENISFPQSVGVKR